MSDLRLRKIEKHIRCTGILLIIVLVGVIGYPSLPTAMAAPEISLSPSEGSAGTSVDVEGSGFALVSSVEISFDGEPVEDTATLLGAFAASFDVPESQPGTVVVTATDNAGNSASAEFTVLNDAPVADDLAVSADEDEVVEVALEAADANGDALTFAIVEEPGHGELTDFDTESGTATYMPEQDYSGDDTFAFNVNDGFEDSNTATVSISVASVNDPPLVEAQSVSVDEGDEVDITLEGSDPEGDELTFSISGGPEHGTLSGTAPELVYQPAPGYSGSDSFEFAAYDGEDYSEPAAVEIEILGVNSPPVAGDVEAETDEDESVTVYLSATDSDSDELSFAIESAPSHGHLGAIMQADQMSATVTYTPLDDYNGSDSFTFTASDGEAESDVATAEINIEPVNDVPVVVSQSVAAATGEPIEITLTGTDADGDVLDFFVVEGAQRGTLSSVASDDTSAVVTYTPDPDESGSDSFTFQASDGTFDSNIATVSITLPATSAPPEEDEESQLDDAVPGGGTENDVGANGESAAPGNLADVDAADDGTIPADDSDEEVPVPDAPPADNALQGAALQSLSTSTAAGGGTFVDSPAIWLVPGALIGLASVVGLLGYREKSLKKGYLVLQDKLANSMTRLGVVRTGATGQAELHWLPDKLMFWIQMNKVYRILNSEKGRAARKQIFDVQYNGARVDQKEYESSKSVAKEQLEQIGSILRANPQLQESFFDSFGEITIKVWWALKDEVDLDGRKGMRWESLEWLGSETEKYWSKQSSNSAPVR